MIASSVVAAGSPFPFSIGGFGGLSVAQIVSFFIAFVVFNIYVVLVVAALAAFYVTSKPRHGRVRTAALWHFVAVVFMVLAFISLVWGAPAENTFLNDTPINTSFGWLFHTRHDAIYWGAGLFALPAIMCMLIGFALGARQKREIRDQVLATA